MNLKIFAGIFLVTFIVYVPLASLTATPKPAYSPTEDKDEAVPSGGSAGKMHAVPFRGTIASFDDKTRVFTIAGKETARSLKVTDTTVITKGGNPATIKDVVANEEVRGSYYKMSDGTLEAKTVKLGPLTEAEKAEKEARKEKREKKKAEPSAKP
jgi:hypothetical protein